MWWDEIPLGRSWASLWSGYTLCHCGGIRRTSGACPACGAPEYSNEPVKIDIDGRELEMRPVFLGAEGRYEDWIFLQMLESEWKRPLGDQDQFLSVPDAERPASRAIIVLLFWAYFETRVERLLRTAMRSIPQAIVDDLLQRYSSIGSRLDRLYRVMFGTTYWEDLILLGFDRVRATLIQVQSCRNSFAHGSPKAVDNGLVEAVVGFLRAEHESWIAVFNHRCSTSLTAKVVAKT